MSSNCLNFASECRRAAINGRTGGKSRAGIQDTENPCSRHLGENEEKRQRDGLTTRTDAKVHLVTGIVG